MKIQFHHLALVALGVILATAFSQEKPKEDLNSITWLGTVVYAEAPKDIRLHGYRLGQISDVICVEEAELGLRADGTMVWRQSKKPGIQHLVPFHPIHTDKEITK